ncbi:MAG: ATP/GTP-binding protein, partial [Desulfurococcaceae archaeon]
ILVNLDPAVEELPYEPDVDVRDYVDIREVVRKTGLGPNGALIASIDLLLTNIEEVKEEVWSYKANYVVVDTPGQMELFAFRQTGPIVLKAIISDAKSVSLFLIDSTYMTSYSNLFSALLLAASTHIRLKMPLLNVISKIDLLQPSKLDEILEMLEDPAQLATSITSEKDSGLMWDIDEVFNILEKLSVFTTIPVSNKTSEGFDDLYAAIQRVIAGGEDYYTEEPNPAL